MQNNTQESQAPSEAPSESPSESPSVAPASTVANSSSSFPTSEASTTNNSSSTFNSSAPTAAPTSAQVTTPAPTPAPVVATVPTNPPHHYPQTPTPQSPTSTTYEDGDGGFVDSLWPSNNNNDDDDNDKTVWIILGPVLLSIVFVFWLFKIKRRVQRRGCLCWYRPVARRQYRDRVADNSYELEFPTNSQVEMT